MKFLGYLELYSVTQGNFQIENFTGNFPQYTAALEALRFDFKIQGLSGDTA